MNELTPEDRRAYRDGVWLGEPTARRGRPRAAHDRKVTRQGYVLVRTDEGWKPEHRVVMERHLGRKLRHGEHVFHLDGDRQNNDPANLTLDDGRCPACGTPLGFAQRLERNRRGLSGQWRRVALVGAGQARLWRGAP